MKWIRGLEEWFGVKVRGILGPEPGDNKRVTILGRVVTYNDWGIGYEADPKHRELVLDHFEFGDSAKGSVLNGDREDKVEEWELEELDAEEAKKYRGIVARLNYLSLDCPDLQFPVKQCSRDMARPTRGSWKMVKKVARYLVWRRGLQWRFEWQEEPTRGYVASDSDWGAT